MQTWAERGKREMAELERNRNRKNGIKKNGGYAN